MKKRDQPRAEARIHIIPVPNQLGAGDKVEKKRQWVLKNDGEIEKRPISKLWRDGNK